MNHIFPMEGRDFLNDFLKAIFRIKPYYFDEGRVVLDYKGIIIPKEPMRSLHERYLNLCEKHMVIPYTWEKYIYTPELHSFSRSSEGTDRPHFIEEDRVRRLEYKSIVIGRIVLDFSSVEEDVLLKGDVGFNLPYWFKEGYQITEGFLKNSEMGWMEFNPSELKIYLSGAIGSDVTINTLFLRYMEMEYNRLVKKFR